MKINKEFNNILNNRETKPFLADSYYPDSEKKLPLVIFVHGYKGYKDWGAWNLMAEKFAEAGFYFVKFNFSHNGTTLGSPEDFKDLNAFAENNYSKELSDLKTVISFYLDKPEIDRENLTLIGHSRGGGIAVIQTFEDERIRNLITLASVDTLDRFPKEEAFETWKKDGVYHTLNGRTKQNMPHHFQFFEDFEKNRKRFDIESAAEQLKARVLIIHGTQDESVEVKSAENLHMWNPNSEKLLIEGANHTFGAKEPWTEDFLPDDLETATQKMIEFLKDQ